MLFPISRSGWLLSSRLVYIALLRIIAVCQWNTLGFSHGIFVHCERWIIEVHHALDVQSIQLVDNLITAISISNIIHLILPSDVIKAFFRGRRSKDLQLGKVSRGSWDVKQGQGSKFTGWSKARQQTLTNAQVVWFVLADPQPSLWVLRGLPINHINQGETEAVRSRPRQSRGSFSVAEASQWNTEAAGMRPRHQNFLPSGSLEARHLPRGLHH